MVNLHFSEKSLGLLSPRYFAYNFFEKKIFVYKLHSINRPNFIVIILKIIDFIISEIKVILPIEPFFYIAKKSRSSCPKVFYKKCVLRNSQNSQENTCARGSFLIKLQAWSATLLKKESLAQVFSCEFCEFL